MRTKRAFSAGTTSCGPAALISCVHVGRADGERLRLVHQIADLAQHPPDRRPRRGSGRGWRVCQSSSFACSVLPPGEQRPGSPARSGRTGRRGRTRRRPASISVPGSARVLHELRQLGRHVQSRPLHTLAQYIRLPVAWGWRSGCGRRGTGLGRVGWVREVTRLHHSPFPSIPAKAGIHASAAPPGLRLPEE